MFENKVPVKPPIKEIYIELFWSDQFSSGSKRFADVNQFASFLKDNPDLGNAVGYVVKSRKN